MLRKIAFHWLICFGAILAGGVVTSCRNIADEMVDIDELAAPDRIVEVSADASTRSVKVYSNGAFTARLADDTAEWVRLLATSGSGDCEIGVEVDRNDGLRRQAAIILAKSSGKTDTVRLRQRGLEERLTIAESYRVVNGSEPAKIDIGLDTNVAAGDLKYEVTYPDGTDAWIKDVEFGGDGCHVEYAKNPSESSMRRCDIRISFLSAWEETVAVSLRLTQKTSLDRLGTELTFGQAHNEDGSLDMVNNRYRGDYTIEGVVVSDCASENMAFNPNLTYNSIDRTANDRTVYIEELGADGSGLRLWLASGVKNTFRRGTKVRLNLSGTTLQKSENPTCWSILNVSPENILETAGDTPIPLRERTIATLTDNDMFTYCRLRNVEFEFKQGAYSNVYEAYMPKASSLTAGVRNVASVMRTAGRRLPEGPKVAICGQVHAAGPWRRALNSADERRAGIPQGVGSVGGIIVAGENIRYGGRIGAYSIRPLDESDIDIGWESDSSSSTLAEWVFDREVTHTDMFEPSKANNPYEWEGGYVKESTTAVNRLLATGGEQRSAATLYCNNLSSLQDVVYDNAYRILRTWRPQFADGFDSEYVWDGDDWGVTFDGVWKSSSDCMNSWRSDGKGVYHHCGRKAYSNYVWCANLSGWFDWNADGETYYATRGFMVKLSTASATRPVHIGFTMGAGGRIATAWNSYYNYNDGFMNSDAGYYAQNYPLYWKVQYSTDSGMTWNDGAVNAATGEEVFKLLPIPWWTSGTYPDPAAPELVGTAYVNAETAPGLVEYKFRLPAEASGQREVVIRITPASTVVATLLPSAGNYAQPLDQGVRATKESNYGNMIRLGGIKVEY